MNYFDITKVGDEVYSLSYGSGKVFGIRPNDACPIQVLFDRGFMEQFTRDGKLTPHSLMQDLYWQKPDVTIIDKGKRLPDLPVVMPRLPTRCPECGSEDMHHGRTAKKGRPITQCLSCKGWFGPRTA